LYDKPKSEIIAVPSPSIRTFDCSHNQLIKSRSI
jgi:hypothetical protein